MNKDKIPQKKERVVLIDGRNLLYRAYFSHKGLAHKGKSTSAIYGYPAILKSIIWKLKPKKVYVVWDGKLSKHRTSLLPTYKKRDKVRLGFDYEDFERQEKVVMETLKLLGISQVYHKDIEADDLIYGLATKYKTKRIVYIVSSDKDFDQLLDKRVRIWNDKENLLLTHINLKKKKGYKPFQCVDYLSMLGDDSDKIPGYRGIGEKGAIEFLNKFGSIYDFLENDEAKFKKVDKAELRRVFELNRQLIDLKVHWDNNLSHINPSEFFIRPAYDIEAFRKLAKKYSLNSLTKRIFVEEFKNQYYRTHKKTKLKKYDKESNINLRG
jgi:DNA polymerase-1